MSKSRPKWMTEECVATQLKILIDAVIQQAAAAPPVKRVNTLKIKTDEETLAISLNSARTDSQPGQVASASY